MSLYLSFQTNDESLKESEIYRAVTSLASRAGEIKQSDALPQGAGLDIRFVVADEAAQPQSENIRIGGYSSETGLLSFQVTVPARIVNSPEASHFAATALLDAIDHALLYFRDTYETHGIRFKPILWHKALIPLFKIGAGTKTSGMAHA